MPLYAKHKRHFRGVDMNEEEMSIKQIEEGSILISEQPFVYILSSKLRMQCCDYCFKKGELLKCSRCQYVHYCDRTCQKAGWALHKSECSNLKNVAPRLVPDAARLMARLIRKLEKGGDLIRSYYTKDKFRMFKDLMSHYSDLKLDQRRMEHFVSICSVLFEFLRDGFLPNSAELIGIYGRMCVNSFNICDQELNSLGSGIYLAASIIDHACEPNAVATFEGTTLYIRALKKMNVDWTKIFISYIDILNNTQSRQEELQATYYFLCKCPRCLDDGALDVMYGAACPNGNCDGCINMNNFKDAQDIKCYKCLTSVNSTFVQEYKEVTELTELHLENMKHLAYLDVCKVCLKRQEGVLYRLNLQHVKILDMAFESSIDFGQWNDAKKFGNELVEGYLFYYGKLHPSMGLLYLKLGKILIYMEQLHEASYYLKNAYDILKTTHGTTSKLFREEIVPLLQQVHLENVFV